MKKSTVLSLFVSGLTLSAFARVEPSALFSDHAVLLRAADTPVFGFAEPGEKVSVTLGAASASAVADAKGAWLVRLDLRGAPKTPQTLTMNDARAEDVLVGEVWLCSGQSNMSFTLASADDAEAENKISNAEIRCFHVDTRYELKPNPRIAGRWLRDVPQEKLGFSAIGYYFAKRLQAELGAPVGVVNSSVGASTIEAWCDPDALAAFPEGKRCLDGQIAFMANYRDYERTCQAARRAWAAKWNRADRPHAGVPKKGWRALAPFERDSFRHGPGAIWLRRVVKPAPGGLVLRRRRFIERQWRFDASDAEFYFNGRRLGLSYPASPIEKNTELFAVPAAEASKGGELAVRLFNALDIPDVLHYLSADGRPLAPAGWELAVEFDLPGASADAVKDLPSPQRFCLSQHYPGALHNGMIAGLVPMGLSGVVWYQGESNATRVEAGNGPEAYAPLFGSFIRSWRNIFNKPELPFVWCQLASLGAKAADANEGTTDAWVALRAAQQRTLALPQTGQVILLDAGEQGDIHPRDKRTPGRRLADWALNRVYGRADVPGRGPHAADVAFADGRAKVRFGGCAGGLVARDLGATYVVRSKSNTLGKVKRNSPAAEVEGFALAGADGVWRWADAAEIRGETVEVSAKSVPQPVAVRYGWSKNPYVNLCNAAGLPAEPFERKRAPVARTCATLSTADRIGTVSETMYGGFIEHLGRNVYGGVYDPQDPQADEDGFRRDVIAAMKDLATPIFRYPGGCFTDFWCWEDGIGPREKRPVRIDPYWKQLEDNSFGLDEFMKWLGKVGAKPMLTVNLSTRGLLEFQRMWEYLRFPGGTTLSEMRRANGRDKPYDIRYWCLGNELYGSWEYGNRSPERYGEDAREVAKFLKGVDRGAVVVLCGGEWSQRWNETVLGLAWNYIDMLSIHQGTRMGRPTYNCAGDVLSKNIENTVATIERVNARQPKAARKHVRLAIDEYFLWDFDMGDAKTAYQKGRHILEPDYTLRDAVVMADLHIAMHNHARDIGYAGIAQSVNVLAPVRTEKDGRLWRQTIYDPLRLVSRWGRGEALALKWPGGQTKAVRASAIYREKEGEVVLFVVNRSADEAQTLEVGLQDDWSVGESWELAGEETAKNALGDERIRARETRDVRIGARTLSVDLKPCSWRMIVLVLLSQPS